jgi:predicted nucleic acid-binding protein
MGINYLWDTNIAIYYLQNQFPSAAEKFIDSILLKSVPSISVITEIELLSWKSSSKKDTLIIKQFISDSNVFELDQEIKNICADIRKEYGLKLPDAIIAATSIFNNLILITRNTKDFQAIKNLQLINPFEM